MLGPGLLSARLNACQRIGKLAAFLGIGTAGTADKVELFAQFVI